MQQGATGMYSLKGAAEAVGRSKTAILRSIQKGRFSATRNGLGEWEIDPSELHRVYKPVTLNSDRVNDINQYATKIESDGFLREIQFLKEQIEREREISRNLFRFLDEEKEERRKLTSVLTYQKDQDTKRIFPNLIKKFFSPR